MHRHRKSVLNLIYRFIGDRTQAKDLAQEVFQRVWQGAKAYKPEAKFTTWLYRITKNLCLNELKSARRRRWLRFFQLGEENRETVEENFADDSPSAEDLLLAKERSHQISDALQSLPENQRLAIILNRYDNLSYEDIAQVLSCSIPAVESLLVRAKGTLHKKLKTFQK